MTARSAQTPALAQRVNEVDWNRTAADLDDAGIATTGPILTPVECSKLRELYGQDEPFRSTIDMARHRFGHGQYRYFAHPLPAAVAVLRASFWPHLLPIARDWAAKLQQPAPWPDEFDPSTSLLNVTALSDGEGTFPESKPHSRACRIPGLAERISPESVATVHSGAVPRGENVDWERKTVRTDDGTELAAWSSGPPDGAPIVLVHGFSVDHTTWHPVADILADRRFRVITLDIRGHGQSALGSTSPTLNRLVNDLADVLASLDVSAAHLVGHSLGAVIVLSARVNEQLKGSISSVTSIAGTEQALQNPFMKLGSHLLSSRFGLWLLRRPRSGRAIISTWFAKNPATADVDWIRELSASCERATRSAVTSATGDIDLRPTFTISGPPTLVISGQDDKVSSPKVSKRIAAAIDGAELHLVEDAGHMVIVEKPDTIAELVASRISRLP